MSNRHKNANGDGSISKRADGRWMARYWVTLPDGTRKRQSITKKSRDEVVAKLHEEQRLEDQKTPKIHDKRTTGEFLEFWLTEVAPNQIRETTLVMYELNLRKHVIPNIGHIPLTQLSPEHIRQMIRTLEKNGATYYVRWKSKTNLSSALSYAVKLEYVHRNVAQLVPMVKAKYKERSVWSKDQVAYFLESSKDHRLYPMFCVMFHYGTRRGETLGLRWQDIDFERGTVSVRQQLQTVRGVIKFVELKTKASERTFPLLPEVREALLRHRDADPPKADGLLFHTTKGNPVDVRALLKSFHDLSFTLGLPRINLHEIRHTVATLLKDMDVSPKDAQAILGHADITTTLQIYTHSSSLKQTSVLNQFAGFITK